MTVVNPGPISGISDAMGALTINNVSMHTEAWHVLDLFQLWTFPDRRGDNALIPSFEGRRAYPRIVDQTVYTLPFFVTGACNEAGVPNADPMAGLQTNLDYLWEEVVSPDWPDATMPAELEMPDGQVRVAEVQVDIVFGAHYTADAEGVLILTVPAGRFVYLGS